jgi:hypothetical protein
MGAHFLAALRGRELGDLVGGRHLEDLPAFRRFMLLPANALWFSL